MNLHQTFSISYSVILLGRPVDLAQILVVYCSQNNKSIEESTD